MKSSSKEEAEGMFERKRWAIEIPMQSYIQTSIDGRQVRAKDDIVPQNRVGSFRAGGGQRELDGQ